MTINTPAIRLSYNGDGATTAFPIPWTYFDKDHVVVTLRDVNSTETTLVLGTDYTLTAVADESGGTLTATTAPATGETLIIDISVPDTQVSPLPLGGEFPSTTVERISDLDVQRTAQLNTKLKRSMLVPVSDSQVDNMDLPIDTIRRTKLHGYDDVGAVKVSDSTVDEVDAIVAAGLQTGQTMQQFTFTGDGTTTAFTMSGITVPSRFALEVFVDGLAQDANDYSIDTTTVAGSTIVKFNTAPPNQTKVRVHVLGFSKPFSTGDASGVSFTQSGTGAVARTVEARLRDVISVLDFIPVAEHAAIQARTSTFDAASDIQEAIDKVEAGNGGIILFPPGEYVHTGITVSGSNGVTFLGSGRAAGGNGATLTYNGTATGNWVDVNNAGKFTIENITLRKASALTLTGGVALDISLSPDVSVENISILDPYNGISVATSQRGHYDHIDIRDGTGSYALYLSGTAANKTVANTFSNIQITSETTVSPYDTAFIGIDLDSHVNSNFFCRITALYCWQGIRLRDNADAGNPVNWNYFFQCETEKSNQHGVNIVEAGSSVNRFTDCYISESAASGTGNGFTVAATATTAVLVLTNLRIGSSDQHGMLLAACQHISIVNPIIGGNSQGTSDADSGIRVNAGVSNWHVLGGLLGGNASHDPGAVGPQKYAIDIASGGSDNFSIIGCDFGTNQTGGLNDGSTGTNKIIERNGTYLASGEERVAFGVLTSGVTNTFMFAWQNPHNSAAIVKRVIVQITTAGGTGGSLGNIGTAANATTEGDNLLDGIDLNSTGLYDNIDDQGTNGAAKRIIDANGGTTDYVTGRITVANASSLVGTWRIEYVGV